MKYTCDTCNYTTDKKSSYDNHLNKKNKCINNKEIFDIIQNNRHSTSVSTVVTSDKIPNNNKIIQNNKTTYTCSVCNTIYKTKQTYKYHMKNSIRHWDIVIKDNDRKGIPYSTCYDSLNTINSHNTTNNITNNNNPINIYYINQFINDNPDKNIINNVGHEKITSNGYNKIYNLHNKINDKYNLSNLIEDVHKIILEEDTNYNVYINNSSSSIITTINDNEITKSKLSDVLEIVLTHIMDLLHAFMYYDKSYLEKEDINQFVEHFQKFMNTLMNDFDKIQPDELTNIIQLNTINNVETTTLETIMPFVYKLIHRLIEKHVPHKSAKMSIQCNLLNYRNKILEKLMSLNILK